MSKSDQGPPKAKLNVLLAKREQIFRKLQQTYDISKQITSDSDTTKLNHFKVRFDQLESVYSDFKDLMERINILQLDLSPNSAVDFAPLSAFEDIYFEIKAFEASFFSSSCGSAARSSHGSSSDKPVQPRLPKIELPSFDGSLKNWTIFYDKFKSLIHDNSSIHPVEKFHYLLSAVSGPALSIVRSLPLTEQNYPIVWGSLITKYQNKRVLGADLLDTLLYYKPISRESISSFNDFLSTFKDSVASLKALEIDDLSEFILTHLALRGLPLTTRKQFELHHNSSQLPSFDDISNFVQKQVTALEVSQGIDSHSHSVSTIDKGSYQKSNFRVKRAFTVITSANKNSNSKVCPICSNPKHNLYSCPEYHRLTPAQRKLKIRELRYCFNCLKKHMFDACPSKVTCSYCSMKHHSSLHVPVDSPSSKNYPSKTPLPSLSAVQPDRSTNAELAGVVSATGLLNSSISSKTVLLGTAVVHIQDFKGDYVPVRALIDSGAQSSFITSSCVQRLGLTVRKCTIPIAGLGHSFISNIKGMSSCTFKPRYADNPLLSTEAVILSKITTEMPSVNIPADIRRNFAHLILADPNYDKPSSIDFLIAADVFPFLYDGQRLLGGNGLPSAIHSIFGWVITGEVKLSNSLPVSVHLSTNDRPLDDLLKLFWESEEPLQPVSISDPDDQRCEQLFERSVSRTKEGRYIVPLPFRDDNVSLLTGDSYQHALTRLMSIERRLSRNPDLAVSYNNFLSEYERLDHMSRITDNTLMCSGYFIPHHAVMKASSSTTKLRVVFDGSSQPSNGYSLNSLLLSGPKLQQDISVIICHFRLHSYVFTADISKMYRQILVRESDRVFQRILWRPEKSKPIEVFQLNTVTYGLKSSPYLALRTLQQLSQDEGNKYPAAAVVLERDIYIDDLLTGASTLQSAKDLKADIIKLMSLGAFELRKWSSNCPEIIEDIPTDHRETPLSFDSDGNGVIKVLGLQWNAKTDVFSYQILTPSSTCSKRSILSHVARMYDPLGWLSPVVFKCKCLIQRLWQLGIDWDDPVPDVITEDWSNYCNELPLLTQVQIPRCLLPSEIIASYFVGFSDASERGYSAVVYLVSFGRHSTLSNLVYAKSKVAPLKTLSIPRLELCGALLLSRLLKHLSSVYSNYLSISGIFAFSDSTTVLTWLKTSPNRLKTYVATRVSKILDNLPPTSWNHISTELNPADCSSRGLQPSQLIDHPLWWNGPPWLVTPISNWPLHGFYTEPTDVPDLKNPLLMQSFVSTTTSSWILIDKISSYFKLLRFTAWFFRYKKYLLTPKDQRSSLKGPLTLQDIDRSLFFLIRKVQEEYFSKDLINLPKGQPCHPSLQRLNPFIDEAGVLRVGGRLKHSSLPECSIYPIILPKSCHFTNILIDYYHLKYLHAGPRTLQSLITRQFWILCARKVIRSRITKCLICFKSRASPSYPLMGNLPRPRVTQGRPFINVGVDFGGPFSIKESKRRNAKVSKCYLCLFVCFATKATHLEVVSDLSTDAFLAAFERFVSRRGLCHNIYSDRGTNFVGARRHLNEVYDFLKTSSNTIINSLSEKGIQWHLNPASAPHFNGLSEAGIKSAKSHLKRILRDQSLTFEEMATLFSKIEAIMNSRPLCSLSSDPLEFDVLTPGHFLVGAPLTAIPTPNLSDLNLNRLNRWQVITRSSQHFWSRWSREYLHTLQQRQKWLSSPPNLERDQLVILIDDRLPPMQWKIGRIEEIHPGADGIVRVAKVRTAQGSYVRPTVKLCPLPLH